MNRTRFVLALPVIVAALCTSTLVAQTPSLKFDVATIRLAAPNQPGGRIKPIDGGHGYTVTNMPVRMMISVMYRIPRSHITGGPSWLDDENYDVEARCEGEHTIDDLHIMFQDMLADRFGLRLHKERKEGNVYALTVAPGGIKMTVNTSPPNMDIPITPGPPHVTGVRVSMGYLSYWLGQVMQNDNRTVVDMTGLDKSYDFKLAFLPPQPPGVDTSQLPENLRDLPDVFTALRNQLGLKLRPQKAPITYYAVESVHKPTDN